MSSLTIDKKHFDENGYVLVQNVFTLKEIEQLREKVYEQYEIDKGKKLNFSIQNTKSKAKYIKGDLLSKEKLYSTLLDDRILEIARTILGGGNIVYFGDSSYQIGTGLRGFHRDNIDRANLDGLDWKSDYTLIRIGIYLQNHKKYSGGLKVKAGTHKNADGKTVFVNNEEGDVAVWSLKTIHSGNAVRLKFFPNYTIDSGGVENYIPSFLKKDQQKERISLFMTFALPSAHVNRYINEYFLKRQDAIDSLEVSVFDSNVLKEASQKKVEIMKLLPQQ